MDNVNRIDMISTIQSVRLSSLMIKGPVVFKLSQDPEFLMDIMNLWHTKASIVLLFTLLFTIKIHGNQIQIR